MGCGFHYNCYIISGCLPIDTLLTACMFHIDWRLFHKNLLLVHHINIKSTRSIFWNPQHGSGIKNKWEPSITTHSLHQVSWNRLIPQGTWVTICGIQLGNCLCQLQAYSLLSSFRCLYNQKLKESEKLMNNGLEAKKQSS